MVLRYLVPVAAAWLIGCDGGAYLAQQSDDESAFAQEDQPEAVIEALSLRHFGSDQSPAGCENNIGACAGAGLYSATFSFYPDGSEAANSLTSAATLDDVASGLIVATASDDSRAYYRVTVSSPVSVIDVDLLTNGVELYSIVTPYSEEGRLRVSPSNRARAPIVTLNSDTSSCHSLDDQRCVANLIVQHYSSTHDRTYRALIMGRIGDQNAYHTLAQPQLLDHFYRSVELLVEPAMLEGSDVAADDQLELRVVVSDKTFPMTQTFNHLRDIPGAAFASPPLMLDY